MSPPAKKKKNSVPTKASVPARQVPERANPIGLDVAVRAYQLFVQRGSEHGHDWEDWFAAERQLVQQD